MSGRSDKVKRTRHAVNHPARQAHDTSSAAEAEHAPAATAQGGGRDRLSGGRSRLRRQLADG